MLQRLFLLGATGTVGSHVLDLALERGHAVTAFVRSPQKITTRHDRLNVVAGSPLDVAPLAAAMAGHEAVISTLGLPPREALRPSTRMAEFAATTVAAMARTNIDRLAIVSAAVLFPLRGLGARFFRWFLRNHARDLAAMEDVVTATPFAWTIARPGRLVRSSDVGYRSEDGAYPPGPLSMSARAVAAFLLDSVEQERHVRAVVGLGRERA